MTPEEIEGRRAAYSEKRRAWAEEIGCPLPKRRPGTFRFKREPNVHDEDAAEFV